MVDSTIPIVALSILDLVVVLVLSMDLRVLVYMYALSIVLARNFLLVLLIVHYVVGVWCTSRKFLASAQNFIVCFSRNKGSWLSAC